MEILPLSKTDLKFIPVLQPEGWPNILPFITFYTESPFCFPLKVVIDNKIAGIGTSIIHNDVAWLAHIIVHPHYRNQGIGSFITQSLINHVKEKGVETIYLIATDLGASVYEKLGFLTETEYLFFKDLKFDKHTAISQNIRAIQDDDLKLFSDLDLQISGEDRYFHLVEHAKDGFVYWDDNRLQGFYLPEFGEGLIVTNTKEAGIELMKLRFTTKENAVIPIDNRDAIDFMHSNNYHEFKTAKRMRLGTKRNWFPQNVFNRIGGNLG